MADVQLWHDVSCHFFDMCIFLMCNLYGTSIDVISGRSQLTPTRLTPVMSTHVFGFHGTVLLTHHTALVQPFVEDPFFRSDTKFLYFFLITARRFVASPCPRTTDGMVTKTLSPTFIGDRSYCFCLPILFAFLKFCLARLCFTGAGCSGTILQLSASESAFFIIML